MTDGADRREDADGANDAESVTNDADSAATGGRADPNGSESMTTETTPKSNEPTRESGGTESTLERLTTLLNYAVLGGLLLLAAISAIQLYLAVGRTISTFVTREYRAPLMVAFNLAVLLVAALGISLQLRRLSGDESAER